MKLLKKLTKYVAGTAVGMAVVGVATAATSASADFDTIVTLLKDWSEGSLGKVLALAMFIVGIAAGIVRQSVMAAVAGVAGALVLAYGPTIIDSIFTATI